MPTEGYEYRALTETGIYKEHQYESERELERQVVAHAQEVFGPGTLYFDIKQRVATKLRAGITDGFLLDFRHLNDKTLPFLWVVEYELYSHDLQNHVIPQLRRFVKAIENSEETKTAIADSIHREIMADAKKLELFRQYTGETEVYLTLKEMLHADDAYANLLIYDRIPEDTEAILDENDFDYDTRFLEFKTFYNNAKPPIYVVGPTEDRDKVKAGTNRGQFRQVEGPHWNKNDLEKEVLKLLAEKKAPLGRKEIIADLANRLTLSDADRQILTTRPRWEAYARFAISDLSLKNLIEARAKNQWVITEKGRESNRLQQTEDLLKGELKRLGQR